MDAEKYILPLRRTVAPLYNLLSFSGGLIPLTSPSSSIEKVFYLRYLLVLFIGIGLVSVYGFGIHIVLEALIHNQTVQQIVLTVVNYLLYPTAIATLVTFTQKRVLICNFLQEWRQLEESLDLLYSNSRVSTKKYRVLSIFMCCYSLTATACFIYLRVAYAEEFPSFASHFTRPGSTGFYISFSIEMAVYFYAVSLGIFGEIMSSYVYLHLAFLFFKTEKAFLEDLQTNTNLRRSITRLTDEDITVKNLAAVGTASLHSGDPKPQQRQPITEQKLTSYKNIVNKVWERTEYVSNLINQAQSLFGFVLFTSYATSFFTCCFGGYFIFLTLRSLNISGTSPLTRCHNTSQIFVSDPIILSLSISDQLTTLCKLVLITTLCNTLSKQLIKTRNVISNALHCFWDDFEAEDRLLLSNFLHHLRLKNWSSSPLDLFKISSSTLLSMYSLVTTYVIVLLQTECVEI